MIKIRKKAAADIPNILQTSGITAIAELNRRYDEGERNFKKEDFESSIYGDDEVKAALINLQDGKCCFCESKIRHISYGDVEHFRPKAGWIQADEKLNKPGYYWLTYEWNNLLLSCEICNQRYKRNLFPLLNPASRATSHHSDLTAEEPVFIHPANDEPEQFITFKEEIPFAINDNQRGDETIAKLGLRREALNEQRRTTYNMLLDIYDLARGYPETYPELKAAAKNKLQKYYDASVLDETEYASMLRCFFRDNPIDF